MLPCQECHNFVKVDQSLLLGDDTDPHECSIEEIATLSPAPSFIVASFSKKQSNKEVLCKFKKFVRKARADIFEYEMKERLERYFLNDPLVTQIKFSADVSHSSDHSWFFAIDKSSYSGQPSDNTIKILAESFIVLPNHRHTKPDSFRQNRKPPTVVNPNFHKQIKVLLKIHDIISNQHKVNHIMCRECRDQVISELEKQIQHLKEQIALFSQRISDLSGHDNLDLDSEKNSAKDSAFTEQDLLVAVQTRDSLREERIALLNHQEEIYSLHNILSSFLGELELDQQTRAKSDNQLYQQVHRLEEKLQLISSTNILDSMFHISYDGHFGTINGLRLGTLAHLQVPWGELNAALGESVFLLHTVARLCRFTFPRFVLFPQGSISKICTITKPTRSFNLFVTEQVDSDIRMQADLSYALTVFLHCISEIAVHVQTLDQKFHLKYSISNDTIGKASVRYTVERQGVWTKAMKNILTNLKFLLAWCALRQRQS